MSEYKVCFTKIREINPHPNPAVHSLEIATVYGFQVVIRKGSYQVGDFALYIPIDSVFKDDLFETIIMGPNPKIKLNNSRVRQIRIQKFPSQGMLVSVSNANNYLKQSTRGTKEFKLEEDYSTLFRIEKYEPPQPEFQQSKPGEKKRKKNNNNPLLHSYNGLSNMKWFPDLFTEDEEVVIQEKLHGTNCRAGLLPSPKPSLKHLVLALRHLDFGNAANEAKNLILNALGKLPKYEFCYGSNNVELTNRDVKQNFYGENVYDKALRSAIVHPDGENDCNRGAKEVLKPMEVIYGEIIGAGLQKGYDYGHKDTKQFVLFDVKIMNEDGTFRWLNPEEVEAYAKERGFRFVPVLYTGKFNAALAKELTLGSSVYCPDQKVREGVVIKSRANYNDPYCSSQKRALKLISELYLDDSTNTDNH